MFDFGERKITRMGYSCIITLPKPWIKNHGLGAGDRVRISMDVSGKLIIEAIEGGNSDASGL